jgi:hypothetical protein
VLDPEMLVLQNRWIYPVFIYVSEGI